MLVAVSSRLIDHVEMSLLVPVLHIDLYIRVILFRVLKFQVLNISFRCLSTLGNCCISCLSDNIMSEDVHIESNDNGVGIH